LIFHTISTYGNRPVPAGSRTAIDGDVNAIVRLSINGINTRGLPPSNANHELKSRSMMMDALPLATTLRIATLTIRPS